MKAIAAAMVMAAVSAAVMVIAVPVACGAGAGHSASDSAGESASDSTSGSATVLSRYLAGLRTLRADFTQTVTDPHGVVTQGGSGSLLVQRPGEFRWDYEPHSTAAAGQSTPPGADVPQGQLLVADGKNLWFYDRELAQVTVKPLAAGLSSTPIMLLSGSTDDLRASFTIAPAPMQDGLSWVEVRPRSEQADFSDARLGFKADELVRMLVHDMLGQTVQLDFAHSKRNTPIEPAAFQFKVPAGVDVIGSPAR